MEFCRKTYKNVLIILSCCIIDWVLFMEINKVKENNFEVIGMIAYYLINHSDFITQEMIDEVVNVSGVDEVLTLSPERQ